jgi:hypothetical protein
MSQIAAGTNYNTTTNKIVTADNLNQHVNNATLQQGAISLQQDIVTNGPINSADQLLIRDASANTLNKATLAQVFSAGVPLTTTNITSTNIQNSANINTLSEYVGASTPDGVGTGTLKVYGEFEHQGISHTGIACGNNEQRPSLAPDGAIRFNNEEQWLEVFDGTEWKQVGYSPFEASGGNIIIGPSDVEVAAQFSSTDGITFTVTVSAGHDVNMGQLVEIKTATAGYSGTYLPESVTQFTVVCKRAGTAAAPVAGVACTIRKTGDHKIHIFKNSGFFITGSTDTNNAEILVVGGGGGSGGAQSGLEDYVAGGGGGVSYARNVTLLPNTTYSVVVGQGGVAGITISSVGGNSSFSGTNITLSATGGKNGTTSYPRGGASGTGTINGVSFSEVLGWSDTLIQQDGQGGIGGSMTFLRPTSWGAQARVYASGYLSGITNKLVSYGKGGISRRINSVFDDASRGKNQSQSMLSSFAAKGFDAIGHGGNWNANLQFAGTSGIVIVRYPYKLS